MYERSTTSIERARNNRQLKQRFIFEGVTIMYDNRNPTKEFMDIFNRLAIRNNPWEVWADFITMYACAISNAVDKRNRNTREVTYMQIVRNKKYGREELDDICKLAAILVNALEENPEQDFLGDIYMKLELGNKTNGQFFTPYCLCELMSNLTMGDAVSSVKKKGYISIHDPTCGAGATLIAGIHSGKSQLEKENLNFQNHLLITGQDVDRVTALMCYIQISLLGVAGFVKIGDSLAEPMLHTNAELEDYWYTPMYFSDVWTLRRMLNGR